MTYRLLDHLLLERPRVGDARVLLLAVHLRVALGVAALLAVVLAHLALDLVLVVEGLPLALAPLDDLAGVHHGRLLLLFMRTATGTGQVVPCRSVRSHINQPSAASKVKIIASVCNEDLLSLSLLDSPDKTGPDRSPTRVRPDPPDTDTESVPSIHWTEVRSRSRTEAEAASKQGGEGRNGRRGAGRGSSAAGEQGRCVVARNTKSQHG